MSFDFIILGGGTAGLTLARQLLDSPKKWRVLVVEGGGDPRTEAMVPQFFPFNINNTNTWNYTAQVVNGSSNAFKNGAPMQFGKQLGGSSACNAMLYVVGNKEDYDGWVAQGCAGWSYDEVLPFIKKSEGNTDSSIVGNGTYHSTTGNVTVTSNLNNDSIVPLWRNAFLELNYSVLNDYNARDHIGYVKLQSTIKKGERMTSYRAFITSVGNNTNLYIMKNSLVQKINFDATKTKAVSVVVQTNQANCLSITISATREVIVTAGALGTPQILQRSGVGRAADLPAGVTQVNDLNVGRNLMDHVYAAFFYKINPNATAQSTFDVSIQALEYYFNRTGPFAEFGISNVEGFVDTLNANGTNPDVVYLPYHFPKNQTYFAEVLTNFGYKDEYIKPLVILNVDYEILMFFAIVLQPYSRGSIKINSLDPTTKPTIVSGYYTDSRDIDTQLRCIRTLFKLMNTTAMSSTQPALVKFDIPECNGITDTNSDDYLKCYMKYFSLGEWHPSGTCKMGNSTATNAVVDTNLKVYGFTNLRVCDASIIPMIPRANTQVTVYMIAQKCADLVQKANP